MAFIVSSNSIFFPSFSPSSKTLKSSGVIVQMLFLPIKTWKNQSYPNGKVPVNISPSPQSLLLQSLHFQIKLK